MGQQSNEQVHVCAAVPDPQQQLNHSWRQVLEGALAAVREVQKSLSLEFGVLLGGPFY